VDMHWSKPATCFMRAFATPSSLGPVLYRGMR
jgi:hypothetical protein